MGYVLHADGRMIEETGLQGESGEDIYKSCPEKEAPHCRLVAEI